MFLLFRGWGGGCLAFCPLGGGVDGGCLVFLLFWGWGEGALCFLSLGGGLKGALHFAL